MVRTEPDVRHIVNSGFTRTAHAAGVGTAELHLGDPSTKMGLLGELGHDGPASIIFDLLCLFCNLEYVASFMTKSCSIFVLREKNRSPLGSGHLLSAADAVFLPVEQVALLNISDMPCAHGKP